MAFFPFVNVYLVLSNRPFCNYSDPGALMLFFVGNKETSGVTYRLRIWIVVPYLVEHVLSYSVKLT